MDSNIPAQKEVVWFKCCTNGKPIGGRKGIPEHMFIILTKLEYNKKSDHLCAVPITSKKGYSNQEFLLNYGLNIIDDDLINSSLRLDKESFVLCDRPSRVDRQDLSRNQENIGRISQGMFDKIVHQIFIFLGRGKIHK